MLKKFGEAFKKEDGKPRDWVKIEGGANKITELHGQCLKQIDIILEEFKKVIFPENLTVENPANETPDGSIQDSFDQAFDKITHRPSKTKASICATRILSEEEI